MLGPSLPRVEDIVIVQPSDLDLALETCDSLCKEVDRSETVSSGPCHGSSQIETEIRPKYKVQPP